MRRLARPLLITGTVAVVLSLGQAHAAAHGYDYTGSFRFAWSLAYIALLVVAAYGAGLPDLPRTGRSAFLTTAGSTAVSALGISVLQLVIGSALLPRFVLFGTPAAVAPLAMVCWTLARTGSARAGQRDRVVAVAGLDEASS